jgi:hypothetical protein
MRNRKNRPIGSEKISRITKPEDHRFHIKLPIIAQIEKNKMLSRFEPGLIANSAAVLHRKRSQSALGMACPFAG